MGLILPPELHEDLLRRHRGERDGRVKDRIKAVLLRDKGYSYEEIADALLISDEGARKHVDDYLREEKLSPANGGSEPKLTREQADKLIAHLESHTYLYVREITAWTAENLGVEYSVPGMTAWLHRQNFSYHQPAATPAKADAKAQEAWLAAYENLKNRLEANEEIVFMDGVHPTHEVRIMRGWIRKGTRKPMVTNGSGRRLNILGALNLEKMQAVTKEFDWINGKAICGFYDHLQSTTTAKRIYVVQDQARYQTCPEVREYLARNPRIQAVYLPTYSPNLNAIEPLWKLMHEHCTYNRHYAHFKDFTEAIRQFFAETFPKNAKQWTDRLTDNFRVIQSPLIANA
jgi:transposase